MSSLLIWRKSKKKTTKKNCLIMTQHGEESWLAEAKVWELSQLGWLAGGYYTDWMCTDPHLAHQEVEDHLVSNSFVFTQSSLDTLIWVCVTEKDATQVRLFKKIDFITVFSGLFFSAQTMQSRGSCADIWAKQIASHIVTGCLLANSDC